jgi:hypothetical protein
MEEICDSLYWMDMNTCDEETIEETNEETINDSNENNSIILKDTDSMYIEQ